MPDTTIYANCRSRIRSGDLLAFRPGGLIASESRGPYSHVGMAVWRHADQSSLSIAESREWVGGRVVSLSGQIRKYPGIIDVFSPNRECPDDLRERAATVFYNWAYRPYPYWQIARMSLIHMPILRRILGFRPDMTDMTLLPWDVWKVCSVAFGWVWRWAKKELKRLIRWDPVPCLGDSWIEPNDLTRSGSFELKFKGLVIA